MKLSVRKQAKVLIWKNSNNFPVLINLYIATKINLCKLNLVSNNSLMCPLNEGIFYLSESATHQEEYFLKHDHYYGIIITFVNVNTYR